MQLSRQALHRHFRCVTLPCLARGTCGSFVAVVFPSCFHRRVDIGTYRNGGGGKPRWPDTRAWLKLGVFVLEGILELGEVTQRHRMPWQAISGWPLVFGQVIGAEEAVK